MAKGNLPGVHFMEADIRTWTCDSPVDLIFSNAAMQWITDHGTIFQ